MTSPETVFLETTIIVPRGRRPIVNFFAAAEEGTKCSTWTKMYLHMGKAWTHAISLAVLLACCICSSALDPSLDVSQYSHTVWKVRDGFSKGVITSLAQTPDGYLWVGTESGLLRF